MQSILHLLGFPTVMGLFVALIVGVIALFRVYFASQQNVAAHPSTVPDVLVKKYPGVDLNQYAGLIRNIAFVITLGFIIVVFEYPTVEEQALVELTADRQMVEEMQEIPPTEHKTPPPPMIKQPEIVEVPDEVEIQQEIKIDFGMEANEEAVVEEVAVVIREEKVVEEVEEIFEIVEESAAPVGGYDAFYAYVGKNMKYPRQAIDLGVSGKVYVQFVIAKDGSITDVKTIRGIGYGCDEEAVRVVSGASKWKPGKQRGRAVKQRMVIPIMFKLSDI